MSKKQKKVCRILNYIDDSCIVSSTNTGCISISGFTSLVGIPIGITTSGISLKIFVITAGSKKYKSIIKEEKKNRDKIMLAKSKLNSIEALTSKALTNWNISHNEFVLINNALKEFYDKRRNQKFQW